MICKPFCHTHVLHILHTYPAFPILQMETHSPFNHLSLRCGSTCTHEKSLPKPFVWGACYTQSWYFFSELGSTLKPSVKQHAKFTLWMHLIYKHSLNCYPAGRQSFWIIVAVTISILLATFSGKWKSFSSCWKVTENSSYHEQSDKKNLPT